MAQRYIPGRTLVSKFRSTLPTFHVNTTASVRRVAIGSGQGVSKSAAKRAAATKALEYFHENGIEAIPEQDSNDG
jgi:ribosomal protein S12 methylthiotransferase accessory factor YcaO